MPREYADRLHARMPAPGIHQDNNDVAHRQGGNRQGEARMGRAGRGGCNHQAEGTGRRKQPRTADLKELN